MELNFTMNEKNGSWESEFKVESDFNLHIEGVAEGNVRVGQRGTPSGKYADVRSATPYPSFSYAYDFDFSALVYPKWIKVVCPNEPEVAVVTFNAQAMNKVLLNVIHLNSVPLNLVGTMRSGGSGGGGGGDVPDVPIEPDIPEGYETFVAFDGPFLAADGEFYVKLQSLDYGFYK